MKPCFRVEIVVETALSRMMIDVLEEAGAPGYTVLPDLRGMGDRGVRWSDEPSGDASNCMFLIACDQQEVLDRILEGIRPLLSRHGGVCLVSSANWLRH